MRVVQLADDRRLMPLVKTQLVGTQIVEEVSEHFGLYQRNQPGGYWHRVDDKQYSEDGDAIPSDNSN